MDFETTENTAATVRDMMDKLGAHAELPSREPSASFGSAQLITLPDGRSVHDLTEAHRKAAEFLKPARRKGTARLADLDSLVKWAMRFKGETTALFASPDLEKPTLTCIADYHEAGPVSLAPDGDPTARHCAHRAIYDFPLSDEWKAWMAIAGEALDKDAMGEFIEANAKDILDPTPAILKGVPSDKNQQWENSLIQTAAKIDGHFGQLKQLLTMSRSFQVHETSNVTVTTNRDTGEANIQFLNEHKAPDGKPLSVPNLIIVAIPVFRNGALYRFPVRFRYRKSGPTIKFILTPYNPERSFEDAFKEAVTTATEKTDLPVFHGHPEA